jgi:23S rRNA pseudouridine1911/1915/1917 synthase
MLKHGPISPNSTFSFLIPEDHQPCRIDRYIAGLFPDYSRSYFQKIIESGGILINNVPAKKPSAVVYASNSVIVTFPQARIAEPDHIIDRTSGIDIITETEHFIAIHKPATLLVHAPSSASNAITVVDWIRHHYGNITDVGPADRPGIIHRLDRETSGVLLITKTHYAHNTIGHLFRERKISKTYKALVQGHPPREGTITLAIGRNPVNRLKMTHFDPELIDAAGKIGATKVRHAKTDFMVLEYFNDAALVEVKPTTGRTHQIRVHMSAIGHPIIGDQLYGKKSLFIDRHALHAEKLSFSFDHQEYGIIDPITDDFQQLINHLRTNTST